MKKFSCYFILIVLLGIAGHMLLFEQGLGGDGWGYYATCESVWIDGDLNLDNNMYGVYNGFTKDPETGRYITQYPPGLAIMNTPFFLIGNVLGSLCPVHIPQDKIFNNPNFKDLPNTVFFRIFGFVFAHNVYALLGLLILYRTLRINKVNESLSAILVLLTYVASPLHYYAQSGMSHANSFFLMACVLYCFSKYLITRKPYFWFLMGVCIGMATAVRYTNGLALPISLLFALIVSNTKRFRNLLYLTGGFAAIFWVLPLFWWLHAHQLKPGYTASFFFTRIPLYTILLSPRSGFFIFHPLFALSIPGFILFLRKTCPLEGSVPRITSIYSMCLLIPFCIVYSYWGEYYGGDSYSQRYIINCLPLFTFCMVPLFMLKRPWRNVIMVFTVAATAFSYVMFLVCLSRILTFPEGYIWPQYIGEYGYLFTQNHTIAEFLDGLRNHILTLKALKI